MRNINTIQFTYAEVREALNAHFHCEAEGVRVANGLGYAIETCARDEEPGAPPRPTQEDSKEQG